MTRMHRTSLALAVIVLGAATALAAAGSYGSTSHSAAKKKAALSVRKTSLGKVLVDSKGMTLYMFGADTKNKSNCADACAENWPPAAAPRKPTVGSGVSKR